MAIDDCEHCLHEARRDVKRPGTRMPVTLGGVVAYHWVQHGRQRVAAHAQDFIPFDAVTFCGREFVDERPRD